MRWLKRHRRLTITAIAIAVLATAFCGYGCWEATQLSLVERDLVFDGLPPAFDGFRILHLSDLHTNRVGLVERRLRRILERTPADLLVLTGDFKAHVTTDNERVLASLGRTFEGLRYPWGMLAIPGNHDSPEFYLGLAERGQFTCLLRSSVLIEWQGQRLALLGMATVRPNDGVRGEHEIDEAAWTGNVARRSGPFGLLPDGRPGAGVCDAVARGDAFRILLAHVPDFIVPAKAEGIPLILAGDTHGGQIRLPFHATLLLKSALTRRYIEGHFVEGATQMHVSRGIGTLYVPIRFLCPPEVTLLTLRRRTPT
ncbi:MAG: metallophosphoesterase [Planctomycetes bacterium]|nr:metallophosphoesterase [Planctomycetota bacterium]